MAGPTEIGFFRPRNGRRHMNPFYVRPPAAQEDAGGYLTLREAADLYGLTERHVLTLLQRKRLVGHRERGQWRVTRYSIEAFLGARRLLNRTGGAASAAPPSLFLDGRLPLGDA